METGPEGNHDALKMSGVDHFVVRQCYFEGWGGISPVAWVTAAGGRVHHNTIVLPERWVLRILQETIDPRFQPCRDGIFEDNLVIYDSRIRVFVNVGPGTAPETFIFQRNAWCDVEGSRRPSLPVPETDGIYFAGVGAEAYKRDEERLSPGNSGGISPMP